MRNVITIPFVVLLATIAHAQGMWSTLNIPSSARYDDIYFVNDSVGWGAGGPTGWIRKTVNGGATRSLQFTSPSYLRTIEFEGKVGDQVPALFAAFDGMSASCRSAPSSA